MQAQSCVRQPVSVEKAEPIHIALASDGRFFPGLRVTAASIACYASREAVLVLHILDGGIPDEAFENLRVLLGRIHPQATPRRHRVNDETLKDCPEYRGSRLTYARLLLPALLPDVRHIIYCDCDFLWRADIAELWRERHDSIILQSTRDGAAETEAVERRWFASHGYTFESPAYFCAGLMICNLELFRTRGISKQAFDFLRLHPDVNRADQTALNVLLSRETRLLPQRWQRFSRSVNGRDLQDPIVIHYGGENPWEASPWWKPLTDSVLLWHRFNDLLLGRPGGSLALYFSPAQILFKRALQRAMRLRPFRSVLYAVLRIIGRASYQSALDGCSRNLRLSQCPMPDRIFSREGPASSNTTNQTPVPATGDLRSESGVR
jgi:lipopolysaccharide biosynthesis glycosyltransferase